jgi:hypothetical protein
MKKHPVLLDQGWPAVRVLKELEVRIQPRSKLFHECHKSSSALRDQTVRRSRIRRRGQYPCGLSDLRCRACELYTEIVGENGSYPELDLFVQPDTGVQVVKHASQVFQAWMYVSVHGRGARLSTALVSEWAIDLPSDPEFEGGVSQVCPDCEAAE